MLSQQRVSTLLRHALQYCAAITKADAQLGRAAVLFKQSQRAYGDGGLYFYHGRTRARAFQEAVRYAQCSSTQDDEYVLNKDVTWHHSRAFRTYASGGLAPDKRKPVDSNSPEAADRIVEELRYRDIKVPRQLDISWRRRVQGLFIGVYGALKATLNFIIGVPSMLFRAMRMSPSEWWTTLQGWSSAIKHEAAHYWAGFKLFGFELRVAIRLVWKRLKGKKLSRRERRQLTRTTTDIFRVVPFSLFIIIPFAEVLLPVVIRIFPNMLPSTFETRLKKEEDMKKLLKLKTELAGFLQQTVAVLAKDVKRSSSGHVADEARALTTFLCDVRDGKGVSNADITKFARLFNDELTLDNLDLIHLVTLCQFLSLRTMGTEAILRARLQTHLVEIKADDLEIRNEGIENLTDDELRSASRARGMPAPFGRGCTSFMQIQLQDWIELSLDRSIPSSLLLLSRAFKIQTPSAKAKAAKVDAKVETVASLKETFSMLPDETLEGVEMETFQSSASPQKRLEYLRKEEQQIQQEDATAETKELDEAREALEESHSRLSKVFAASAKATAKAVVRKAAAQAVQDEIMRRAAEMGDEGHDGARFADARAKEKRMGALISSLVALANASGVAQERELFMEVASREVNNQMEKLRGGSYMEFGGEKLELTGVRPACEERADQVTARMTESVKSMLIRIESELDATETKIGKKLKLLDGDNDGIITKQELLDATKMLRGDFSDEEKAAVTKLLDGRETLTLQQLEQLGQKLALDKRPSVISSEPRNT